ncbi:hypothetical protein BGP75_26155 [Motiliproteus sp. MSK22-1]|nr:hypothetical protein BGP75_26155 [Motiliproteus sp. MSK22-1]
MAKADAKEECIKGFTEKLFQFGLAAMSIWFTITSIRFYHLSYFVKGDINRMRWYEALGYF